MAELIQAPSVITAAGYPPKRIEEYAGLVNNGEKRVSIALMRSPSGWSEPAQTARFDEYTLVLGGTLHLDLEEGGMDVSRGQAVLVPREPSIFRCACRRSPRTR
jgi:ethanolamine utilization protein EutQ (cupin superfamily)